MNNGVANSSSMSVPCIVNSWLYCESETTDWFGPRSWTRISIAMIPASRKNTNDVIRYMCPMILWSVEDSHPCRTFPLRSVRAVTPAAGVWRSVVTDPPDAGLANSWRDQI